MDKKLDTVFDEVSAMISRNDVEKINFYLETLKKENDLDYDLERSETEAFELIIQIFGRRMRERRNAGEDSFKIFLQTEHEQQGARLSE